MICIFTMVLITVNDLMVVGVRVVVTVTLLFFPVPYELV